MYEITGPTIGRKSRYYIEVLGVENRVARVALIDPRWDAPIARANVFEDGEYLSCHFTQPAQGFDVDTHTVLNVCDCPKFYRMLADGV